MRGEVTAVMIIARKTNLVKFNIVQVIICPSVTVVALAFIILAIGAEIQFYIVGFSGWVTFLSLRLRFGFLFGSFSLNGY